MSGGQCLGDILGGGHIRGGTFYRAQRAHNYNGNYVHTAYNSYAIIAQFGNFNSTSR